MSFRLFWAVIPAVLLLGCSEPGEQADVSRQEHGPGQLEAVFEWFEYQGKDTVFATPLDENQYRNPILTGFYPDPSVVRVGEDFYLVNSTFGFYPGIPVFHSRNLVDWEQIGNVIDRAGMLDLDRSHLSKDGVYAPTIEYHDGLFYVANTCVRCGGNYMVTADNPAGPWSDPVWLPEVGGIDPSLFFDDGRVFVLNTNDPGGQALYDGHKAIWIREVDPVTFQPISERRMLVNGGVNIADRPIWVEGPHLYKVGGAYYLSAAEGGTGMDHRQVVFRSAQIWGPYEPWENNPVLTQRDLPADRVAPVTSTGHADLVTDPEGNWWVVFLATRTYDEIHFNTGRETFLLPVNWQAGWPAILDQGMEVPYTGIRPELPRLPALESPAAGNFILREAFDALLPNNWLFIRIPKTQWWHSGDGQLTIEARNERIGDTAQPSVVARRVQHMNMVATTSMRFTPAGVGDEAGLIALQSDEYYFALGAGVNEEGETVLRLRHRHGADMPARGEILNEIPLDAEPGTAIQLRIEVRGGDAEFSWSSDGKRFDSVYSGADARTLSTMNAGGFVGAVVGMYAEGLSKVP